MPKTTLNIQKQPFKKTDHVYQITEWLYLKNLIDKLLIDFYTLIFVFILQIIKNMQPSYNITSLACFWMFNALFVISITSFLEILLITWHAICFKRGFFGVIYLTALRFNVFCNFLLSFLIKCLTSDPECLTFHLINLSFSLLDRNACRNIAFVLYCHLLAFPEILIVSLNMLNAHYQWQVFHSYFV